MKRVIFLLIGVLTIIGTIFAWPKIHARIEMQTIKQEQKKIKNIPVSQYTPEQEEEEISVVSEKTPQESFLNHLPSLVPKEKILQVPFICQNPFQDKAGWKWHDESCEEAAVLQAVLYFTGEKISKNQAHEIILNMIAWQKKPEHFGTHKDLYNYDLQKFIQEYFALDDGEVLWIQEIDKQLIQKIITKGFPLIVPVSGKEITNPYYPYPGYHVLTVIGYTPEKVITNDNGTKRGEKYPYEWEVFLRANKAAKGGGIVITPKQFLKEKLFSYSN